MRCTVAAVVLMAMTLVNAFEKNVGANIQTPGLSGSFDFTDFQSIKAPLLKAVLGIINNLSIDEPVSFDGGYFKGIKINI